MLGGLHIELTDWEALGKWLASSGWTTALVQADIAAPGKADSLSYKKQTHKMGKICLLKINIKLNDYK